MIQVRAADREAVEAILAVNGPADCVHYLGKAVEGDRFVLTAGGQTVFSESRTTLRMWWAETTPADAASARQPGLRRSGA